MVKTVADNKLTDKEIIKALECCKRDFSMRNCLDCPYNKEKSAKCMSFMIEDALDLINRQQAEIEKLNEEKANFDNTILYDLEQVHKISEKSKTEAIKELAEKTNKMITEIYNKHIFDNNDLEAEEKDAIINFSDDVVYGFDNLVKEMEGEV